MMIVVCFNLTDQRSFHLMSTLNGCRGCEIVLARKFDVIDVQSRIRCVVMELIVVEIK